MWIAEYMATVFSRQIPHNEVQYDPVTWVPWTKVGSVVFGSSGAELTSINDSVTYIERTTNLKASTKYGLLYYIVSATKSNYWALSSSSAFPTTNLGFSAGNNKVIATTKSDVSTNTIRIFLRSASGATDVIKIKDIRLFELPTGSVIMDDFTNLTADQLNEKYPFV